MQSGGRGCSPAPDSVLWKLIFPRVLFSGGVFFHKHRYHPLIQSVLIISIHTISDWGSLISYPNTQLCVKSWYIHRVSLTIWPRAKQCLVLGYHFGGSHPLESCHTTFHTPVPSGIYDNSMAGGRLVRIPYCFWHTAISMISIHLFSTCWTCSMQHIRDLI